MKILMLSDFYPPIIGGLERHVQLLSEGLTKRGHRVTVCTIGHEHLPNFKAESGVNVFRFGGFFQRIPFLFKDSERKYHPPIKDWIFTKKLEKVIETEKPDIVHAHGWITYSILPLKKKLGIPLVVTLHDYGFVCPKRTLMNGNEVCMEPFKYNCIGCGKESYGLIKSFFSFYGVNSNKSKLKLVDKFIAVCSFVSEVHSRYLALNAKDIVVIPNFYELKKENPNLKKAETLPGDFILFVGILAPYKGVDTLIESYDNINTKTKMVLIGAKQKYYSYRTTDNIIVIESAPGYVVKEAYSRCRFVVIPSIWPDPCPTVAFEAMALKKPVIASAVGGLTDIIIPEKTGLLVPPNDPSSLAMAIEKLINHKDIVKKMGKLAYQRFLSTFDAKVIVPKIENVYRTFI